MINKVKISKFKGFREFSSAGFKPITLIGGQNNVGKTNILEALFISHDHNNHEMFMRLFNWRGIMEVSTEPEALWGPYFWNYDMNNIIDISFYRDSEEERFTIKYLPNYGEKFVPAEKGRGGIKTDGIPNPVWGLELKYGIDGDIVFIAHHTAAHEGYRSNIEKEKKYSRLAYFHTAKGVQSAHDIAVRYGKLDIEGRTQWILEDMKLIEPRLQSISSVTIGSSSMLYGDIGLQRKIPISAMGEGTVRFLSIVISMATSPGGLILIDEIENGLHYSIMPKLWALLVRTAKKYDCQLIATTHSYECLQAALEGISDDSHDIFGYIRLDRNNKEEIVSKTYNWDLLNAAIDGGWEVR